MKTQFHELLKKSIVFVSKRSTFFIALALVLFTTCGFTAPVSSIGHGNDEITASFHHDFRGAQIVAAEGYKNFTKLTFKMNDQVMFAFYSETGELLAVTRNIPSSQLPVSLLLSLQKQLNNSWITELFEFNSDAQNCYYVTLENADMKVNLRSNGDSWEVFSTSKK